MTFNYLTKNKLINKYFPKNYEEQEKNINGSILFGIYKMIFEKNQMKPFF